MTIVEYIVERSKKNGVQHFFGIPGDFAIPFFAGMDEMGIEPIILAHEPSLGYAADASARINGLSIVFVTYGAGALNMVNSIAQAYAENSPVIVISGAPELTTQYNDLLVHHKVKSFQTQLNIYEEVTCIAKQIEGINSAQETISEVFETVLKESRPGYIEIPRELIRMTLPKGGISDRKSVKPVQKRTNKALKEISTELFEKLATAQCPVILAGNEIARKRLNGKLEKLIELFNIPCMTSMSGKSVINETHPNCIGTYMGKLGEEQTFNALQESDLVLILGARETDMDTGLFSARATKSAIVHAVEGELKIGYHKYDETTLEEVLDILLTIPSRKEWESPSAYYQKPKSYDQQGAITTDKTINLVNDLSLENDYRVILDVGDMLFNSVRMRVRDILTPSYYASMGFSIPAAIASSLSEKEKRALVFVGDGAFQMTGLELGVIKRYHLNPIIVLMNNNRYETMCVIDQNRKIYDTPDWDYCKIAEAAGIHSVRVSEIDKLGAIIRKAYKSDQAVLIEAIVSKEEHSITSKKLRKAIKKKMNQYVNQ